MSVLVFSAVEKEQFMFSKVEPIQIQSPVSNSPVSPFARSQVSPQSAHQMAWFQSSVFVHQKGGGCSPQSVRLTLIAWV
jgi:hypothetical protein